MTGPGSADATPPRLRCAFLGPAGTFTEAALRKVAAPAEAEFVSAGSVLSAVAALRRGEADRAAVPIENSAEG
ncbi:prephenate dehydratase domain-containing protein, partial [Micrococcus sp. SIMBA_131]